MIKLAVFDIDGTLYDHTYDCVHPSSIEAIQKLQANGIKVVIATGRAHYSVSKDVLALNPDYVVGCNGHVVVDQDFHILYQQDFTKEETEKIYQTSVKYDLPLVFKFEDACYLYEHGDGFDWIHAVDNDLNKDAFIRGQFDRHLKSSPQSACLVCEDFVIDEIVSCSSQLKFIPYGNNGYDILYSSINKSTAIEQIMKIEKIGWNEVISFGDNLNDIEMIQKAGIGVAVGNAKEEIKEKADYVSDPIEKDGIYNALKKYTIID